MNIAAQFQTLIPRYPELKGQVAVVTGGAKGIGQDDLIAGVEIAGAPKTMAFLAAGAKTLA